MAYFRALGDNVKRLMDQQKVSPRILAENVGLSESDVLRFLESRKAITTEALMKIAKYLRMDPEALFVEDTDAKHYAMVDCMNEFDHRENEDKILDILDAYCNLQDSLEPTVK